MPIFTPEDLLLYLAGELNESQNLAISEELKVNWALREKLVVLQEASKRVEKMRLQIPRKQTLQNIMHYAMRKTISVQ